MYFKRERLIGRMIKDGGPNNKTEIRASRFGLTKRIVDDSLNFHYNNKDEIRIEGTIGIIKEMDEMNIHLLPYVVYEALPDEFGNWSATPRVEEKKPYIIRRENIFQSPERLSKGYISKLAKKVSQIEKKPKINIFQILKDDNAEVKFRIGESNEIGKIWDFDSFNIYLKPHLVNEAYLNTLGKVTDFFRIETEIPLTLPRTKYLVPKKVQTGYMDYYVQFFGEAPDVREILSDFDSDQMEIDFPED